MKAIPFEGSLSQPEISPPFAFRDDPTKTLFDEGFQGGLLPVGNLAGFFKKSIRYLYGRLHMFYHIIFYANMQQWYSNHGGMRNILGLNRFFGSLCGLCGSIIF
jgi:hypothetical protein